MTPRCNLGSPRVPTLWDFGMGTGRVGFFMREVLATDRRLVTSRVSEAGTTQHRLF